MVKSWTHPLYDQEQDKDAHSYQFYSTQFGSPITAIREEKEIKGI